MPNSLRSWRQPRVGRLLAPRTRSTGPLERKHAPAAALVNVKYAHDIYTVYTYLEMESLPTCTLQSDTSGGCHTVC